MKKKMICISCPQGCLLEVETDGSRVISLSGNKCLKGEVYAKQEIESPTRMLTSTVLTKGLDLKLVPVRTSAPIPKGKIFEAMVEVRKIKLDHPVKADEVITPNFLGLGVDLIATRSVTRP